MWKKIVEIRCRECQWNGEETVLVEDKNQDVNMSEASCQYDPSHYIEWRVARVEEFDALREYTIKTYGTDPGPAPTDEVEELNEDQKRQQAESELRERLRLSFFASNPNAAEQDFERLYPQLRDNYMLNSTGRGDLIDGLVEAYERYVYDK